MILVAVATTMMGRSNGKVMCQKRASTPAPSTWAASYSSSGTDCSPASSMMAKNGIPRQTLVKTTAAIARSGDDSQATRSCIHPTRIIWTFNYADLIFVMTGGGPANATQITSTYTLLQAYSSLDFGYAGALSIVLLLVMLTFTALYLRVTKGVEETE